jgi:hypothetical protein
MRRWADSKSSTRRNVPTTTAAELQAHDARCRSPSAPGEQDAGLTPGRANDDPALGTAVIRQGRRVLHQLELQDVDEEANGRVVIADHGRDEL